MSPDDMARMFMGAAGTPAPRRRGFLSGKLLGAILVAGVGIGASAMSCVGQSFSLRQARAQEGIVQQLQLLRLQQCGNHTVPEGTR